MRICPNCGAENEDNALTCILCELEFDDITEEASEPAPAEEYDEPFEEAESKSVADTVDYVESINEKPTAAPMNSAASDFERASSSGGKGKIIAIAGAVIVLVAGGIRVGAFLLNDKNKTPESSSNISSSAAVSTTASSKAEETTSAPKSTETTTKTQETMTTTETEPVETTAPTVEKKDTTEAVKQALQQHMKEQGSLDAAPTYALYDVNADGIDELFISYMNFESTGTDLYLYKNGTYVNSHNFYTGASICLSEKAFMENVYGGGEMTKIYVLTDDGLLQKDEFKKIYGADITFYHNDFIISESEYNQFIAQYDAKEWIKVTDNSKPVSELIDTSAYSKPVSNNNPYAGYHNGENAPADMVFYEGSNIKTGVVTTESSGLNMRNGPGTSFEVMQEIPKGTTVEILGMNNEWCYVKWSVFVMAQKGDIDYYGYVSADYISIIG